MNVRLRMNMVGSLVVWQRVVRERVRGASGGRKWRHIVHVSDVTRSRGSLGGLQRVVRRRCRADVLFQRRWRPLVGGAHYQLVPRRRSQGRTHVQCVYTLCTCMYGTIYILYNVLLCYCYGGMSSLPLKVKGQGQMSSGFTRGGVGGGGPGDSRRKKLWANLQRIVEKRGRTGKKRCGVTPSRESESNKKR